MPRQDERTRPDLASFAGLTLAVFGIVGGLILEKGSIHDIAQYTAALIVLGGTAGAVLLTSPMKSVRSALSYLKVVFFERAIEPGSMIDEIIGYATKARKQGIVSLEMEAQNIADPFLRKAINLAVDGADIDDLKSMMELEIEQREHHAENAAKVFENGGGYSPTIGIIGAVLGLIQVMKNLENISEVGHGIAVAFVATVYGVALANIFLLPVAGKIRARAANDSKLREMALDGVIGMIEGSNPKLIRAKLEAYLPNQKLNRAGVRQERMAA
jgi:chemotaxis protein MotA